MKTQSTPATKPAAPEGYYTTEEAVILTGLSRIALKKKADKLGLVIEKRRINPRGIKANIYTDAQLEAIMLSHPLWSNVPAEKAKEEPVVEAPVVAKEKDLDEVWADALNRMEDCGGIKKTAAFWLDKGSLLYHDDLIIEVGFSQPSDLRQAISMREKYPLKEWVNEAMWHEGDVRPLVLKLKESKEEGLGESIAERKAPPEPKQVAMLPGPEKVEVEEQEQERNYDKKPFDASKAEDAISSIDNFLTPDMAVKIYERRTKDQIEKESNAMYGICLAEISEHYKPNAWIAVDTMNRPTDAVKMAMDRLTRLGWYVTTGMRHSESYPYACRLHIYIYDKKPTSSTPELTEKEESVVATLPAVTSVPQKQWWQFWR